MAKTRDGDGFNIDFSDMFTEEAKPAKPSKEETVVSAVMKETPVAPKSEGNPAKSKKAEKESATPYTIYLLSEDDRLYLQFRSQGKHMTMTDFLWDLIKKDMQRIKTDQPDTTDAVHSKFRNVNLLANTSVKATKSQRESLLEPAAKHRLKITRYIAYVVHTAMLNDKDW